jgi:hypothetical protein
VWNGVEEKAALLYVYLRRVQASSGTWVDDWQCWARAERYEVHKALASRAPVAPCRVTWDGPCAACRWSGETGANLLALGGGLTGTNR